MPQRGFVRHNHALEIAAFGRACSTGAMKIWAIGALTLAIGAAGCGDSQAEEIVGRASVIDGDTIEIRGERIRLWGIDAPEGRQSCRRGEREYRCGQEAANALDGWLRSSTVYCTPQDSPDRYGRVVARCTAQIADAHLTNAIPDLGAEMVRRGHALDYRQYSGGAYASEEAEAREAGRGMWAGEFTPPWDWRRQQRPAAAPQAAPSSECSIKGNINRDGERIYHMPGMRSYANTRIDETAGERWFCSAQDAEAAGWRAPRG